MTALPCLSVLYFLFPLGQAVFAVISVCLFLNSLICYFSLLPTSSTGLVETDRQLVARLIWSGGLRVCTMALSRSLYLVFFLSTSLHPHTYTNQKPINNFPQPSRFFPSLSSFPSSPPPPFSLFLSLIRPPPKYLEHKSHSTCLCPPFSLLPFLRFLTLSSLCSQAPPFGPRCTTLGSSLLLSLPVSSQLIERGMLCSLSKEGVQAKEKKGGG